MPDESEDMLFLLLEIKGFTWFLKDFPNMHTYTQYGLIKHFLHVYHNFSLFIGNLIVSKITRTVAEKKSYLSTYILEIIWF